MAQILTHHTVVRDGWHNMCTDLCYWQDTFWLAHARPSAHCSPDGVVVLHRSADLRRWSEVAVFKGPCDLRDPALVATDDKLFVYAIDSHFELEASGKERQIADTYVFASSDGYRWSEPEKAYDKNYWLWRVRVHDGTFYSPEKGGELLSSPDGRTWSFASRIADDGMSEQERKELRKVEHRMTPNFNEADVIFRPDGELWCVSRTKREGQHSLLYISKPPYEDWEIVDLEAMIHCPAMCESGGKVYVAGRRDTNTPWNPQDSPPGNTAIFLLDRNGVTPVFALPSSGDAAYPGLISLEEDRLIISYYSQHAYLGGVIEADKRSLHHIERWGAIRRAAPPPDYPLELSYYKNGPADIYVAEIDLAAESSDLSF
jgi:hypothetical protein